ncbi:ankyrin repeat and LEM domain-containing protein 2 homolog [Musca vetustissima]|uniref:ankyrin repeat and LEM domain-containing protein 2 homolog n=1 Tax=Musca vetustissima TaxID=27455 RepID=UPI002AB6B599|nr:ankyrin repeat and LEM domain-containing protein 2 homolog [Musca vetustissima]
MPFYGLYIPVKGGGTTTASGSGTANVASANDNETAESQFVFSTKAEALKVLKKHKDARLKEFNDEDEAMKYAQTGFEIVQQKYNDVRTSTTALETPAFRGPTKQELARFRKCIEADEYERVKQIIWDNPRYLVSSGDTPTSLKEGCRYNAMHICAISNRPQIAKLILNTVSDTKFVDLLTGKKNDQKMCQELCANLLDYYLNIPEKGRSETPLHFAAKYGFPKMVELLTSYPECKIKPNIDGSLPQDIICMRGTPSNDVYDKIKSLFEERFYVPVLRCSDASIPAQIGEPFSVNNPPKLNCDPLSPEVEIKALAGPMTKDQAKKFFKRWKTPPRLGSNVSSPIANSPFISPMKSRRSLPITPGGGGGGGSATNSPTAMLQRRSLFNSTPQRKDHRSVANDSNGFSDHSIILDDSFEDHQNGNGGDNDKENGQKSLNKIETNNNHGRLVPKLKTGLCPGTPLFKIKRDAFFTYREQQMASPMPACLDVQNETADLFNCSDIYDSPGFKERHVKNTDPEKGIECIGRNLAKEQNVEWREYWDFLEEFIDIASEQGMKTLESYLAQKQAEYEAEQNKKKRNNSEMLEEVCSALEKFGFGATTASDSHGRNGINQNGYRSTGTGSGTANLNASTAHQSSTPYTYVEKSLQVHARRMTKTIVHNIDNVVSINDALLLELRRVKSLIYSFKEDVSFVNVSFEKVHSRIGNLVSTFLENSQEISIEMKAKILKILQNLLLTPGERREHIECVCSRILYKLENPVEQILPENLKTEEMCSKLWSQENSCDCQWESNLSRKTSHRNRMEARYKNHQRMKQQERAVKEAQKQEHNNREYRNPRDDNDSSDDNNEDVFWSDFGSDSEEDEIFQTPPESPSRLSLTAEADNDDDGGYKIFIYGNEPTKRDLDVLNAIFHVELDKNIYPTVHSWKAALMRYTNEEMDFFPSPRIVKKTHTFSVLNKTDSSIPATHISSPAATAPSIDNKTSQSFMRLNINASLNMGSPRQTKPQQPTLQSGSQATIIREPILQLPTAKRLFASPGRPTKSGTATKLAVNETNNSAALTNSSSSNLTSNTTPPPTTTDTANANVEPKNKLTPENNIAAPRSLVSEFQRPLTPLNKIRGLFSAYRDRFESSPLPSPMTERNNRESANSLSLLNISSTTDY